MKRIYRKILQKIKFFPQSITEKIDNFTVTYDPDTDIGRNLYRGNPFEEKEINLACQYIHDNSVVLDIGANIGLHALRYAAVAKNGLVIACEPQPKIFQILEKNIFQNKITNIIPLNLAIAPQNKIVDFYIASDDAYSSLVNTERKAIKEKIKVLCAPIDNLMGRIKIDFVKIDVEGTELSVLESMITLIQNYHPVIFCEIYKGKLDFNVPQETISFLKKTGIQHIVSSIITWLNLGIPHSMMINTIIISSFIKVKYSNDFIQNNPKIFLD